MKTRATLLLGGILLATTLAAFSQPSIASVRLYGQSVIEGSHDYATPSVGLGANVFFRVTTGGTPPLRYQWQFNLSDLPGQTNVSLVLTNVQLTNAGDYTVVVTNAAGSTNRTVTLTVDPTFTKITTGSIVTDIGYSPGGTWGDYNNDGFLDLFVYNGMDGNAYRSFLYRNNGDTTFTKITNGPPVSAVAESYSACWGDYENDDNLDLFVTGVGKVMLYRNSGNGAFTQITNSGVIPDPGAWPLVSWADYDNDGLLDLLLANYNGGASAHSYLFHNNGNGTFTKVASGSIASDLVVAVGTAWGDYDNDGYLDVFICSYGGTNLLYHNNGNGTFSKVTTGSMASDVGHSASCAWGDYNNDGFLDLFVVNAENQKNFLYHNNGHGTFTRITNGIVVNDSTAGFGSPPFNGSIGCAWGDYDNDGWLDLYVANEGGPGVPIVVNFLYHNNGDGTFTKITTGSPVNEYSDSWGPSWADYDNDGFLDLFVTRGDGRGNYLYHNNGNSNGWLTVKLAGTASNRAAIGAKVRVKTAIAGVSRLQLRQITGGSGALGHNELRANFGLGDSMNIDEVRIEWPSGIVQILTNVAPKQILTVVEHQTPGPTAPNFTSVSLSTDGAVNLSAAGDTGLLYLFEASTNLVNWNWLGVGSNATGSIQFTDLSATNYASRFYRVSVP